MEQKKETRGGARPGSGRPAKADKKQTITLRVTPATIEKARLLKDGGVKVSEVFEKAIAAAFRKSRKE